MKGGDLMALRAPPWMSNSEMLNGDKSSWTELGGDGGINSMSKFASSMYRWFSAVHTGVDINDKTLEPHEIRN